MNNKQCSKCFEIKPLSEFRNKKERVDGKASHCKACCDAHAAEYKANNREKVMESKSRWKANNREKVAEYAKAYVKQNPGKAALIRKRHRSAVKTSTPRWADFDKINEIFGDAREFREAGLEVHVDHVIPLQGELVCGLHVPENLTVKLARWNESKGNTFHVS